MIPGVAAGLRVGPQGLLQVPGAAVSPSSWASAVCRLLSLRPKESRGKAAIFLGCPAFKCDIPTQAFSTAFVQRAFQSCVPT